GRFFRNAGHRDRNVSGAQRLPSARRGDGGQPVLYGPNTAVQQQHADESCLRANHADARCP
ncbi:unnamed protein product, partial [Amoebophrya sp. A120]